MDKEMTLKLIDEAVECLYQNREKEAMQKVSALLIIYENMAKKRAESQDGSVLDVIRFMKNLIENYNYVDMIGMADCLKEDAYSLIKNYGSEC